MTVLTYELYQALKELGYGEKKAKETAESVVSRAEAKEFATKSDIADVKADIKRVEAILKIQTSIVIAIAGMQLATLSLVISQLF